jgi:hypothetical protein
MTPLEIVKCAKGIEIVDEDGDRRTLELLPPMSESEIATLQAAIPCPLPAETSELLLYSRGFANGPLEETDFGGEQFGLDEILPHARSIAHDGFGNSWVVDLTTSSTMWGPILYVCHDPPVCIYQTNSLLPSSRNSSSSTVHVGGVNWISSTRMRSMSSGKTTLAP